MSGETASPTESPVGAVRLMDWGVIRASGGEALKFLNGQFTQDMLGLAEGRARLAGYCSAKGRLLATFVAWRCAEGDVLLACSADVLPEVLKRLSMFVLRAQCKLVDASAELPLWGLAGSDAARAPDAEGLDHVWDHRSTPSGAVVRLPDAVLAGPVRVPRYLCCGVPPTQASVLPAASWLWLEARSGVARIVAATVEQFVPQMVNLELTGGVSFSKGCYTGQEVVARSHYLGTLKRRAYVAEAGVAMFPGQEVFEATDPGQPAGKVVLAGSLGPAQHAALVELKVAAASGGGLHLDSVHGPSLTLATPPYELPAAQAGS